MSNKAEIQRAITQLEYYGEKLGCKAEFDLAIKALEEKDMRVKDELNRVKDELKEAENEN